MSDFRDLVDVEGLGPDEETRLRRVHDLLVQAGPPPDLPPALERPPSGVAEAEILQFPLLPRRRWAVAAVAVAALAIATFGGGYLFGQSKARPAAFHTARIVPMHAVQGQGVASSVALIRLANPDKVGNWPMEVEVTGLPTQRAGGYYELWLSRDGKPVAPCGTFRVHGKTTTVRFTVPYRLERFKGWLVTAVSPTGREPGRTVLTT